MDGWINGWMDDDDGFAWKLLIFNIPSLLCQAPLDKTEEYSGKKLQLFQKFLFVIFVAVCVNNICMILPTVSPV